MPPLSAPSFPGMLLSLHAYSYFRPLIAFVEYTVVAADIFYFFFEKER